jgi:hypothetical protein
MKEFDIILVYSLVKKHNYYAHIIKELSSQYRIGLLLSDEKDFYASWKGHRKVKHTDKLFRSLCVQLGAEKIYVNEKCRGKVVIMPVGMLSTLFASEDYIFKFRENFSWDKLIVLFSWLGDVYGLDGIKDLGASRFFVPAKYIFERKMEYEGKLKKIDGLDIIEMGFPHKKYPIFDNFDSKIDYIVAYPSQVHFKENKEKEKYDFVVNLYKLLNKIDKSDKVYLKRHNNNDDSRYFSSLGYGTVRILRVASFIADLCLAMSPFFRKKLYRIGIKLKNSIIERKYPLLEDVTPYHNLAIELFLPHVRKGLITGYSGCQLHALYNELPIYNCDPQENGEVATLPYNEVFLVPFCNGKLVFDQSNFNRISKECKDADVIQLIKEELKGL